MKLSIVTTLYNSAPYIEEFCKRITCSAKKITENYEIIFVNDGSPDNSLQIVVDLFQKDEKIKIIDLSRNFGHHKAIMTGLQHAQGDYIFLIDVDLEEEPEWLNLFWDRISNEKDVDVVYGIQETRKGNIFEKISGEVFYILFNKLAGIKVPANLVTARLTTKRYNQALTAHMEQELFLAGLWSITGFNQLPVTVKKASTSQTSYTFKRKIAILINAFFAFSNSLLKSIFYFGFSIAGISFLFAIYHVLRVLFGKVAPGWTSVIVSIWFFGGLTIAILGLLGFYMSKIYSEVKKRPYTIIKQFYSKT